MTNIDKSSDALKVEPKVVHGLVWDFPVRLFHALLALAVVAAFVTNKLGVGFFKYHLWSGYVVIVLVLFRVVWGVVGTHHAKFWNFVRGPIETLRYVQDVVRGRDQRYAGHNPLGAVMVVALLAALATQAITGLFGNDEIINVGPLYGYVTNDLSLRITSLHRHLFLLIAAAVGLHVLAVFIHVVFKGERLLHAMITGRKPHHDVVGVVAVSSSRTWLAGLVVAALSGALAWVVIHAPQVAVDISALW